MRSYADLVVTLGTRSYESRSFLIFKSFPPEFVVAVVGVDATAVVVVATVVVDTG